jgi:hypothetical protein
MYVYASLSLSLSPRLSLCAYIAGGIERLNEALEL